MGGGSGFGLEEGREEECFSFEGEDGEGVVEDSGEVVLHIEHELPESLTEDVQVPPLDLFDLSVPQHFLFELPPHRRPQLVVQVQFLQHDVVDARRCQLLLGWVRKTYGGGGRRRGFRRGGGGRGAGGGGGGAGARK